MRSDRTQSLYHFHFIVFIFGFSSILGALISLQALPLVIYRMGIAALGLAVFFVLFKPEAFALPKFLWPKVILGGVIIGVHWVTFFHAIKIAGVSLTLSMLATGAIITALVEPLLIKERKLLGYEIVFGSIVILGIGLIFRAEFDNYLGILVALCSAFLSSMFTILNGQMIKKAPAISLSLYELVVGTLVGILFVLFSKAYTFSDFQLKAWDLIWILILAWLCTSYAFYASIKVMQHLKPFTIMMIINLEPVYGILLSLLIWNEKELLSGNFYIGFLIILSAILFNGVYKHRKEKNKVKAQS